MTQRLHILYIYMVVLLLFGAASPCYADDAVDPVPSPEKRVQIFGNVYGGGEIAQVESPEDSLEEVLVEDTDLHDGSGGLFHADTHHKYTTYVHLGENADIYGQAFGGGQGGDDASGNTFGRVIGQTDIVLDGATVWRELYGGGQMADVRGNTLLHFKKGKAGHNAFGGGLGVLGKRDGGGKLVPLTSGDDLPDNRYEPLASADVRYIGTVTDGEMDDAMRTDLPATGNTFVVFDGREDSYTHYEYMEERTIHYADTDGDGILEIAKNSEGNYFDDKKQYDEESPGQYFSINHNIYGGGMTASKVEGNTYVHIRYGMVSKDMLEWTGYGHDIAPAWSKVFKSIANAQFCVFGGGYGYHSEIMNDTFVTMDVAGSGQYKYIEEFTKWFATTGKDKYHWDTNTGTPENIYKAADEATWSHGAPGRSAMDIVGGGYNGKVHGTTHVETSGDLVVRKVYGGGYYASVGNTEVTLKSGIYERVYGGGMIGNVYGTATLNFGQQGLSEDVHDENLHLMVKDAVYGGNDVSGTVGTTAPGSKTHTYGSVTYNVFDPVDDDSHGVRLNIYGGLVLGDVYGAGNGNHPGYSNPDYMDFNLSQHPSENYRQLTYQGTKGTALVYKYRPRTARVEMNIVGNDGTDFNDDPQVDKVRIWGRTFGGGNSCNVGIWDGMQDDNAEVYADDATSWHPGDNFSGAGTIQINIGDHVQLGNRNDSHTTPNGLFMGSNGEHMVTQTTDPAQLKNYHHFCHPTSHKYLPGFLVYGESGNDIGRKAGLKAFAGFINNILTWTDNVSLNVDGEAKDVWMSNFVGGGYRGSMKAKTAEKQFAYTLPTGVTIGHSVVGGAFNAHIVYRIYKATAGEYDIEDGKYVFQTEIPGGWKSYEEDSENCSYLKALYEDPEHPTQITGILRYNFDGGIMGHESSSIAVANGARCGQVRNSAFDFTSSTKYDKDKALVYLNLRNKLDPIVTEAHGAVPATVHGGIVYGGCFHSGYIDGDVWVDYRCSLSPLCKGKDTRFFDKTNDEIYGHVDNLEVHNALNVFGAGYGEDTHTMGDTYLRVLHNGSSDDSYDYPLVYNVFGGGNMGTVAGNTNVYYNVGTKGTVMGSLYGGGYKGTIDGNTFVELAGGLLINAYGGSREANIGGATHVWAYDGANRPEGEDETSPEKAPLLIGNIYGGNDISGTIGSAADESGVEAQWSVSKWGALSGKKFNSYVQVGGTEGTYNGYPLIGNVFAGGNGEKTAVGVPAPDIAKTLLEIDGGTTLRAFGGGNKATVTKDAYILVDAPRDVFTNYTFTPYQKKVLMKTVFKGVLNGYHWDETKLIMDPYHVVKMYGGNNVATMDIQPSWNLKDGMIENVYSGGNMGDMTYYNELGTAATTDGLTSTTAIGIENNDDGTNANYTPRGLSITINSDSINIKNLFGGCRLSNVVPGGYNNDGTLAMRSAFDTCENLYGATINILQGNIENVYGGNDVGGKVYFGTNINISGGILGNVYGSGNGDYLYRFDPEAEDVTERIDDKLGFYYDVPERYSGHLVEDAGMEGSDTHKILTINRIRPAVDKTFINIGGMEHNDGPSGSGPKRVAAVKGNIFMGGNATTITRDGTYTFGKFKLGSYSTINGLFLGSDGHSYTQNDFIGQFAKLNGIENMGATTSFTAGHEDDAAHNPILLNAYLMAVDMQSPPKDFTIKEPLTEAYLGTFCGGGNRGSMLHDKTVEMDFPADLVIYDKIVAGCMNATVNYNQNGTNVQSLGGYTRPLDNDDPNDNTKIRYTINSQFKPLVMDAEFDKVTGKNKHNEELAAAMGKGFVYDNLNTGRNAWMTGCNIYGGCYESGVMVGDVELNVTSSLLGHMANDGMDIFKGSVKDGMDDGVTNKSARTKFDNALANGQVIGNIYGAGFGQESDVQGDVRINIYAPSISTPGSPVHPSANNVYGGGRSGQLHGNSYIRLTDGHVYNDVVGGCDAATMYGSTYIGIGYPKYYECNTTGAYNLTRGDQWNSDKITPTVYYKEGDFIAPNVWSQMSTADQDKFAPQNEMVGTTNDIWNKTDIIVRGGVYGGGFTVASSTTGMAGDYTVLRELDGSGNKTNYGGNSTIVVTDHGSFGDADHIRISTRISSDTGDGGIYGDGHLTFCEGFRAADVNGYGYNTATPQTPRLLNTFQRLDLLDVTDCCLELQGAQDFATNQIDATVYSATRIDELRLKSSLDNNNALTPLSNTNGTAAAGFSTPKVRNYIGFNNNVHYLGAIVTNDAFDTALFHNAQGAVDGSSRSYKTVKDGYITAYTNSSKNAEAINAFKARNLGTARNCIGINNGYCLRVQNLAKDGTTTYYGPIVGVAEVKLLTLTQGEGGGYVYADNVHDACNDGSTDHAKDAYFLNTSGNFVFPGAVSQGNDAGGHPIADQYIVDDCFTKHFGTPEAITTKSGALDEAHYWYVEGNKYFYNTTLTGYTYQDPLTFDLIKTDPNVVLSGLKNGSSLNVKKVEWFSTHRDGYGCVLENSNTSPEKTSDYEFDFQVLDLTDSKTPVTSWDTDMPRYTKGDSENPLTTGMTLSSSATPIFNVKLQDKLNNSGNDNYTNHLDEPELVKIYLVGSEGGQEYEYTITLNIIYLQGPTYEGGVDIMNCALPGERIGFSTDGITIKTPDLMPITATSWKKLPLQSKTDGNYKWDTATGELIDGTMYSVDLNGSVTGAIPALYNENEYNIAFIFTAGGHDFPVLPSSTLPKKEQRMIVVHNYHRMKDISARRIEDSVVAGARVYIEDEADLTAFAQWVKDGKLTAGVDFILQSDIKLTSALTTLNNNFAGTFHGDGYHIDLNGKQETLFGAQLTGKVYNLGLINGTSIATTGEVINSYVYAVGDDYKYGKKAYDLSHYFTPEEEGNNTLAHDYDGYVYKGYANGDYQYATTDRVWSLRTDAPNYGHTETHHNTAHTHDAARWVDTDDNDDENDDILAHTGYNRPLHSGTAVVADKLVPIGVGAEYLTYHGLPEGYANDYLFFGQHLDKEHADACPVHIDGKANGGNRVFETAGYYQSQDNHKFYYNKDAWALNPTLTAIDFTEMTSEATTDTDGDGKIDGDGVDPQPAAFTVDSNADYTTGGAPRAGADAYSNAAYGHVTQNLLIYNDDEAVFAYRDTDGSDEVEVRYHNIVKSGSPAAYATDYFHLVDKQDFNAPIGFTVNSRAWYERKPQAYRNADGGYAGSTAWEGICLPFQDIDKVSGEPQEVNGESHENVLSHFYGEVTQAMIDNPTLNDRTLHHEYWLTGLVAAEGDKATFARPSNTGATGNFYITGYNGADLIYENLYYRHLPHYEDYYDSRDDDGEGADAVGSHVKSWYEEPHLFSDYVRQHSATPYLCAFPGDDFYEFSLENQTITFEKVGTSAIAVTDVDAGSYGTTTVDTHQHVGTFHRVPAGTHRLGINAAGNAFDVFSGYILPFRTYMATSAPSVRRIVIRGYYDDDNDDDDDDVNLDDAAEPTLVIYGDGTTIVVEANYDTDLRVYTPEGRLTRLLHVVSGTNRYEGFHPSIYIVGGRKLRLTQR